MDVSLNTRPLPQPPHKPSSRLLRLPNSSIILTLPMTNSMIYSTATRNYIESSTRSNSSNQSLEEIRARQEQYILDQFELALRNGLHGRLSPMVVRQRQPTRLSIPLAHTMDGSDSRDNRPLQSIKVDDHGGDACPRSLLERMTLPDDDAVPNTPTPSASLPRFACTICNLTRARVDHNTPDCRHYICFACRRTQPGHWPEDCPGRTPDRYYDASD